MVRLNGKLDNPPAMLIYYLIDDLLQPSPYRANKHLPAPFRAPDDVVDHQMDVVPLVLIIHVYSILYGNTWRKTRGPLIPRLKIGG